MRPCLITIKILIVFQIFFISKVKAQNTIGDIPLPSAEYTRVAVDKGGFAQWLRNLPLEKKGSPVLDFRGNVFKSGEDTIVAAVVRWNISGRRLEQCMDIVIRMYSEYLWQKEEVKNLGFPLPGGTWLYWDSWKAGFRPYFEGLNVNLRQTTRPDSSYSSFKVYLYTIFSESHTQQFYNSYKHVERGKIHVGDYIVRKGTKGHAVMIVDLAINTKGDLIALIGNGDTPACQFFLLNHARDNPWVPLCLESEVIPLPLRRKMSWDGLRRFDLPRRD